MKTKELTSEEDLADLLRQDEPEMFLELVDADYGEKLMAYIGKMSLDWLDVDELGTAYTETLLAVWNKIRELDFQAERPLRMVFAIAKKKALDAVRKKARRQKRRAVNESEVADLVLSDLEGTFLRIDAQYADEEEKRRFYEALPEVIAGLSPQQKAAATAFLECYEELRERDKYGPIADIMTSLTGEDVTPGAAKSALRGAMENIRQELIRRGISFLKG